MATGTVLDLSVMEKLLKGDRQQMRKFADKFIQRAASDLQEIEAAIAAGDLVLLRHLGHRARSAALTVGATAVSRLYRHLELPPEDTAAALANARSLHSDLEQALRLTTASLREAGL